MKQPTTWDYHKFTLYGYVTPPIILKKTVGVRESRPKQVPYVWYPLSIEADSQLPGEKMAEEV